MNRAMLGGKWGFFFRGSSLLAFVSYLRPHSAAHILFVGAVLYQKTTAIVAQRDEEDEQDIVGRGRRGESGFSYTLHPSFIVLFFFCAAPSNSERGGQQGVLFLVFSLLHSSQPRAEERGSWNTSRGTACSGAGGGGGEARRLLQSSAVVAESPPKRPRKNCCCCCCEGERSPALPPQ